MFRSMMPWRREPAPLMGLQREMNRVFDDFFGDVPAMTSMSGFNPRFEMIGDPEVYRIRAELPGMDADDVKCNVAGSYLTIEGEKKTEREETKGEVWFNERTYGQFKRTFTLPDDANHKEINATFDKGLLTITVPRTEESKSKARQIPVK